MNRHPDYLLNQVEEPADIKGMTLDQLKQLGSEMRQLIIERDSAIGGHVGPNLGVIEMTIAYHYVFNSPHDKIIWDVSHQCYAHKMLTGRKQGFLDPDHYEDVSGFTSPEESDDDFFEIGHTSTSIALAVGMARARDMRHKKDENIVAMIGDGSLSGGLAYEGLNNAGQLKSNLIIIVNDNGMSIDENQGGLYKGLKELRETNGKSPNNIFKFMGLDYRYIPDGNDLQAMIKVFKEVKDIDHPIVLHVHTLKGKGYQPAVDNQMLYHWRGPFDPKTGKSTTPAPKENYSDPVIDQLFKEIEAGQPVAAITAAIPNMFDLKRFQAKYPDRYFDVGIAEQMAVTSAVGMAQHGVRPVVFENSSFLQRAYDQLIHDVALNDAPIVMIVQGGTINSESATHQGTFDISYISSLPNIEYLTPTSEEEMLSMLHWAINQDETPVFIRQPEKPVVHRAATQDDYSSIDYDIVHKGSEVAIMAVGDFFELGKQVCKQLKKELNIDATLINPKSVTNIDARDLHHLQEDHNIVVTLEDGNLSGGFGETIDRYYGPTDMQVLNFGAPREFADNVPTDVLAEWYHLTPELICDDIEKVVHQI